MATKTKNIDIWSTVYTWNGDAAFDVTFIIKKINKGNIPSKGPGTPPSVSIEIKFTPTKTTSEEVLDRMLNKDTHLSMPFVLQEKMEITLGGLTKKI